MKIWVVIQEHDVLGIVGIWGFGSQDSAWSNLKDRVNDLPPYIWQEWQPTDENGDQWLLIREGRKDIASKFRVRAIDVQIESVDKP
jgi:ribosomal protein L20A (L18A)